ncbi:hypothetical protein GCM10028807_00240 [Spirosoma daeguense]
MGSGVWAQSNPAPFSLATGPYSFTGWAATSTAGTFPANMVFHFVGSATSTTAIASSVDYGCPYNSTARPRITGRDANGISFISTSSAQWDNCASGTATGNRFIGDAVLALNTTGRSNIQVSWTGGTISLGDGTPTPRSWGIQLQYRLGTTGSFINVAGSSLYTVSTVGSSQPLAPVTLPASLENQSVVQLRWIYHEIAANSGGSRPELRLDDITVNSDPIVAAQPDLTVSLAGPASAISGQAFAYSLVVGNSGAASATNVPVSFTLPAGATFINTTETNGFTASQTDGVVTFTGGSISAGSSATLTVSVSASSAGTITIQPNAAVVDAANTIAESNETNNSSTATVTTTISQANQPPVAPTLANQSGIVAVPFNYDVPNFTDPENQTITYAISGLPVGLSADNVSRLISGTPTSTGLSTVTVVATDEASASTTATFGITINANQPPVASSVENQTTTTGSAFSYVIPAFSDPESQTLAYEASGLPAGLSFDGTTRTISGTPSAAGTSSLTVTATDPASNTANVSFTLTVNAPAGTLIATPTSLSPFSTTAGTASTAQTFSLSGNNLTTNVTVSAPNGFQVSNDGTTFQNQLSLTPSSGAVSATISVRLAGTSQRTFAGTITNTSDAVSAQVAVNGTVSAVVNPNGPNPVPLASQPGFTYTENFADIANWSNGFTAGVGATRFTPVAINATGTIPDANRITTASATFSSGTSGGVQKGSGAIVLLSTGSGDNSSSTAVDFLVDFTNLRAGTLSFNAAEINNQTGNRAGTLKVYGSTDGTTFTDLGVTFTAINNVASSTAISVSLPATFDNVATARFRFYYYNGGTNSGTLSGSRPKISVDDLTVTGTALSTDPALSVSPTTLAGFSTIQGTPSTSQSYVISASNLVAPIDVTAPAGVEISLSAGSGYGSSLSLPSSTNSTTVYVRLTGTAIGPVTGSITHSSNTTLTASVNVSGQVNDPNAPSLAAAPATLSGFGAVQGSASNVQTFTVSATNLDGQTVQVAAPSGYEVALASNGVYSANVNFTSSGNALVRTLINVRTSASAPVGPANGTITITSGALSATVAVSGTISTSSTGTKISSIQGTGATFNTTFGGTQTIEGIVTRVFAGSTRLNGFYVQEEDADSDGNPATSEGIFVYDPAGLFSGNVADKVRVTGTVGEFASSSGGNSSSLTQLSNITSVINLGASTLPTVTNIQFPVANVSDLERYEGMLVNASASSGNLTVTEYFQLGRYGQVVLSSTGASNNPGTDARLDQYTQFNAPSVSGYSAFLADIAKRRIILDDGSSVQNPDPIIFGRGGNPLSASNTLRGGDEVASITAILDERLEGYRLQTTTGVNFLATNTRPATPPTVGGTLKVSSFNLLNYFNGNGTGGGFPTSRGADTQAEFTRQRNKTIQAIIQSGVDVFALNEIENDGYGVNSAIQDLVNGANAVAGPGSYTFINPGVSISSDEITVAMIYKPAKVVPVGAAATLTTSSAFNTVGRYPLAQTFREISSNGVFTAIANHFKSKGSSAGGAGDSDAGDGQAQSNGTRTRQAQDLATWLATRPTGTLDPDYLILGDLNAYAQENPLTTLYSSGYSNLLPNTTYSYVFDGQVGSLDHALGSATLLGQVQGAEKWHINSDEPSVLDYNVEFKTANLITSLYNADQFRTSDHDPVIVGLSLTSATSPLALTFTANPTTLLTTGTTTLSVTVSGGTSPYSYTFSGPGTITPSGNTASVSSLTAGVQTFTVVVRDATSPTSASATATVSVTVNAVPAGVIRITEYMYNGTPGEYVELTNVGNAPIDLNGWTYSDNARTPGSFSLSGFGVVQPNESVVFTEADAAAFRTAWYLPTSVNVLGGNTQNLGRSDEINIYDASGTLVDRLTFNDQTIAGSVRTADVSGWTERANLGQNLAATYKLSVVGDTQNSYLSTNGNLGNPGGYFTPLNRVLIVESGRSTTVVEGGATDTYTVSLNSAPTANVTVSINAGTQLSVSPTTLTFTPTSYSVAQTVTVTAIDDSQVEGTHTTQLVHTTSSTDAAYNGIATNPVSVTITDNDNPVTAPPTIQVAGSTTAYLSLSATGAGYVSGVMNDPTDPASTLGIDFTIADTDTPVANLTVTASSSNTAVTSSLTLTGSDGARNLKIAPAGVGYATVTVTVSDGANNTSYVVNYAASAAALTPATTRFHTGVSDASTAILVDANTMLVADDENQVLRLYNRQNSGLPIAGFDFTSSLGLTDISGGVPREVDIEASTHVGNRIFWLGSLSNADGGNNRPNRNRIFSTDVSGTGASTTLAYVGRYDYLRNDIIAWDVNNGHGKGANFYGLAASAAAGVGSKLTNGFNVEGLELAPNNTTAYVSFRAPQVPPTGRANALVIPVTNFTTLSTTGTGGTAGSATFGAPIEFNLGGRGIREIRKNSNNEYIIIAGPAGDAGAAPNDFRLYTWTGNPTDAPVLRMADLTALNANGSFESVVDVPNPLTPTSQLQLLVDNGDAVFYTDGTIAKELTQNNFKKFRSDIVTLGAAFNTVPTVAQIIAPQSATLGQAYSFVIPAGTFTDAETPNGLTLSVSGLPAGLSFTAPATISGTPSTTAGSPFTITVRATDPGSLSVATTFQLTIVPPANTAPTVAQPIGSQTATVGQAYSFAIPAATFTDTETPNGLTLSVSGLPAGLSFSAPSTISGTPSTTVGSPFTVTVIATDAGSLSVATTFQLTVRPVPNTAPVVIGSIGARTAPVNQVFTMTIPAGVFTDAETPNGLTLSVSGLPAGLSFTAPSTISGTPSTTVGSPFTVTVIATDPGGLAVSTTFQLTVNNATSCVNMVTVKAGNWNDATVWSCGRVPASTDAVTVNHAVTLPTGYTGNALRINFTATGRLIYTINSRLRLN